MLFGVIVNPEEHTCVPSVVPSQGVMQAVQLSPARSSLLTMVFSRLLEMATISCDDNERLKSMRLSSVPLKRAPLP
jgi:hypothetical protein